VWALGVVLYEMITGAKPIEGGIQFELGSAILGRFPSPLPAEASSLRRKVAQLGTAVERCLAKEPGARYQRASDVRGALEAVQAHADEASDSAWKYVLSRKRVVGAVEAVMAEGERRIQRDRRTRADPRKEQLGPPNGIERRGGERRTGRERRAS
jgi:serine/threonine-protein kinase